MDRDRDREIDTHIHTDTERDRQKHRKTKWRERKTERLHAISLLMIMMMTLYLLYYLLSFMLIRPPHSSLVLSVVLLCVISLSTTIFVRIRVVFFMLFLRFICLFNLTIFIIREHILMCTYFISWGQLSCYLSRPLRVESRSEILTVLF